MNNQTSSTLRSLRAVTPHREVTFDEALRVAELQASKLAEQLDPGHEGLRDYHLATMPRITVVYETIPVSGMSHWNGQLWVIAIAKGDSLARQRFTALHEFKHIIDHGQANLLYVGSRRHTRDEQAELAADYFAGCALVPKRLLKAAWGCGIQRVPDLASHFAVSEQAIEVRLSQTGLSTAVDRIPASRCARPVHTARSQSQRFRTAYRRTHA
jgi:Zn-dependent peptidase ImmA (M78 family)